MRTLVLVMMMMVMVTFGGLITTGVSADTPTDEEVIAEDVVEDVVEDTEDVEVIEVVEEPAVENENDDEVYVEEENDGTPKGIIESQTGLVVDYIKTIDSYGNWGAYYCHCDGDLYCITIKAGQVDVCVILN